MRVLCISDILADYGGFDPAVMPEADICLVAGNITQYGLSRHSSDEIGFARTWLAALGQHYPTFVIPGNHDIGVRNSDFERIPGVTPILNTYAGYGELKLYGVAMTPTHHFPRMATMFDFMTSDPRQEEYAFTFEPVDIVISHSPPYGCLDRVRGKDGAPAAGPHVGSTCLLRYIENMQPKLVVCGHIQSETGIKMIGNTVVVNAAKTMITTDIDDICKPALKAA